MNLPAMLRSASLILLGSIGIAGAQAPAAPHRQTHGDWQRICVTQADGAQRCSAAQVQQDPESGGRVLAIELQEMEGGGVQGALALPFGLALSRGVRLAVDDAPLGAKSYGFSTCLPDGCLVPLPLDAATAAKLRKARQLKIHAWGVADGQHLAFQVSLAGLDAALRMERKQ